MKCDQCGNENLELVKSEGALETFKCPLCGNVIYAHVNFGIEEIEKYAKENESDVYLYFSGDVYSKKNLMKLRQSIPELKKYSVFDLENLIVDGKLNLGRFHKSKVEMLKNACKEIGVEVLVD